MQADELPPPVQMVQLLAGFQLSQALYAAAALGVADHLVPGPATVAVLTERTGAHAPSLHRLLRTLAGEGVFTEPEPGVFALTPLGQTLTSSQPGSMRDLAITWMETHYAPFGDLTHTIRTGQPAAEHLYGQPFFSWLSHHPEQATRFTAAMANVTSGIKTAAIASLPLDGIDTIVDLGGADGAVLASICQHSRTCAGCCSTFPTSSPTLPRRWLTAASRTGSTAWQATFSPRCPPAATATCCPSCCTTGPTRRPCASCATFAAAGGSGARLLIIEFVVPPGDAPHMAKMIDLTMLAMVGGEERTEPDGGNS